MVVALTKSSLKNLKYGQEIGFQWSLKGRPTKADPRRVVVLLHHRIKGIRNAKKIKLGTYPDVDIDFLVRRASEYRALMDQGIDPRQQEANNLKLKADLKDQEAKQRLTLAELLDAFEADREAHNKGVRPATVRDRRYTITSVFDDYLDQPVQNISSEILENIFKSYAKENKRETGKKAIRYLNSLMNFAMNTKRIITRNPCATFKGRISTTTNKRREALSPDECVKLLESIDDLTDDRKHQSLIKKYDLKPGDVGPVRDTIYFYIAILLMSGIRKRELLNLRWDDVFLKEEEYKKWNSTGPYFQLMTSKQDQPLGIPITRYMSGIFAELESRRINGFVFPSKRPGDKLEAPLANERKAYPVLQKMLPENTKRLTAQLLRKTFATTAYGMGIDTQTIELMTGHYGKLEASNVAMDQYIAVNVNHHYQRFEDVHMHMLGSFEDTADYDPQVIDSIEEVFKEDFISEPMKSTPPEQLALFDVAVTNEPVTVDDVEVEHEEPYQSPPEEPYPDEELSGKELQEYLTERRNRQDEAKKAQQQKRREELKTVDDVEVEHHYGMYGWTYDGIPNRQMGPFEEDDPQRTWLRMVDGEPFGEGHDHEGFYRGPGGLILYANGQPAYMRCLFEGFRLAHCWNPDLLTKTKKVKKIKKKKK